MNKDEMIFEELGIEESKPSEKTSKRSRLKSYLYLSFFLAFIALSLYFCILRPNPSTLNKVFTQTSSKQLIEGRIDYIKKTYKIDCPKPTPYTPSQQSIASMIDHTLLTQDATPDQVKKICNEALKYEFAAVCVNEGYVKLASEMLKDSKVKIASVVNFPLGNADTKSKIYEAEQAIENGASEIDMVMNCGWMKGGLYTEVYEDVKKMADAVHNKKALLKVIIEATCLEKDELIVDACLLSSAANADFVKTSTGFHKNGGAKVEHVKLMRETVGGKLGVKASGGIRTAETAQKMINAGANRLGASAGVKIVESLN